MKSFCLFLLIFSLLLPLACKGSISETSFAETLSGIDALMDTAIACGFDFPVGNALFTPPLSFKFASLKFGIHRVNISGVIIISINRGSFRAAYY